MLGLMQDWPLLCHRILEHAATIHGSQEIVTRSITGHVTQAMTEHYSHVGRDEKLAAAGSVVRLVFAAKMAASGGSGGGSTNVVDLSVQPPSRNPA